MQAVVAAGFARIFLRNSINVGLPVIECPEAAAAIRDGDHIAVDLEHGVVERGDDRWTTAPRPPFVAEIMDAGGLVEWARGRVGRPENDEGMTP